MDFNKKAQEILIQRNGYSFKTGEEEIEEHLKEVWNEAIEESAKRAGDFDEDWIGDKIRELKEK